MVLSDHRRRIKLSSKASRYNVEERLGLKPPSLRVALCNTTRTSMLKYRLWLLLGDLACFPLWLVRRPEDAGCLLHHANQQVIDVVLQLADVSVLLLYYLLLLNQFLDHLLEREVAIRRHAALHLLRLLGEKRR